MITVLDNLSWAQADLNGNAEFIEVSSTLYVISNVRSSNTFIVLASIDGGNSFSIKATYTFPVSNQEFAPCAAYDSSTGLIHIIGLQNNAANFRTFDLLKFQFDTSTNTLSGPVTLATAETIRSGYDICILSGGHSLVAVICTNPSTVAGTLPTLSGHSLFAIELDGSNSFVSSVQLLNSPNRAPVTSSLLTYNSVSLICIGGSTVELYYEQHPRALTFQDLLFNVLQLTRTAGTWSVSPTSLYQFSGRYSDSRLTVIADGSGNRYLSQTFYNQTNIPEGIIGNLLLGYLQFGGQWFFHITNGTNTASIVEATMSLSAAGSLNVAYLLEDLQTGQVGGPAFPMKLASVSLASLALTDVPGFYNNLVFTWLRGSKTSVDNPTSWAVIAERQVSVVPTVDTPVYISGLNVPPVAALVPPTATVFRGQPLILDASGSFDGDGDPIVFNWSENDPDTSDITLIPTANGQQATLRVLQSVGGSSRTFVVAVVEADAFAPSILSNVSLTSGVLTVTAPNTLIAGDMVGFQNVSVAQFLNGQMVKVISTGLSSTQFEANLNLPDYPSTLDNGQVAKLRHPPVVATQVVVSAGTLTITAVNTYHIGQSVILFGFVPANAGSWLNDQIITLTGASGTQFSAAALAGAPSSYSNSEAGLAQSASSFATCDVTVPANAAPTITFTTNPVNAARNSLVTIAPIYTGLNQADDTPTFTWLQTAGTSVTVLSGNFGPTFTFETNGVSVEGETLVFLLTVGDGVNASVASSISVVVPASWYVSAPDSLLLTRAVWTTNGTVAANISMRNTSQSWGALMASAITTNFASIKRTTVTDGTDRELLISSKSVVVFNSTVSTAPVLLRKLILPVHNTVLDAVHTESDYTLVLDQDNSLNNTIYRYKTAPLISTDNPDVTLPLSNITAMKFNKITSTVAHDGIRVVVLSGSGGCLLLQLNATTMAIQGFTAMTEESNFLFGADNVQWIRFSSLSSLHKGRVLLGTIDSNGDTFETLVDLGTGSILGTWDKSKLRNHFVHSGEFLFENLSTYAGIPAPPFLNVPLVQGNVVTLNWIEPNSNLIDGYIIFYSNDGGLTYTQVLVNSGFVQNAPLTLSTGNTYLFYVVAFNKDGQSRPSNIRSAFIGTVSAPFMSSVKTVAAGTMALVDGFAKNWGVDFGGMAGYTVQLSWMATSPAAAQLAFFTLQQQTDGGVWTTIAPTLSNSTVNFTTALLAGGHTYSFRISAFVTDQAVTTPFSNTVSVTLPLNFPVQSMPIGKVGSIYSFTLACSGSVPPYTFALDGGSLPTGLTLNTLTGQISGTPTVANSFTFAVQVTDSALPSAFTGVNALTITVTP